MDSGSHHLVFVGGVNRERFQRALDRPLLIEQALQEAKDTLVSLLRQEQDEYMNHSPEWYRFNGQLLIYYTITGTWVTESNFLKEAGVFPGGLPGSVFMQPCLAQLLIWPFLQKRLLRTGLIILCCS